MFNGLIIASVNPFTQGALDKNGKQPVILNVVAGKCPNRNVLSGTVAERAGLETGKTYLISCREGEEDVTYGRRFVFSPLKEMDAMEIIAGVGSLGTASIFPVEANVAVEAEAATDFQKSGK